MGISLYRNELYEFPRILLIAMNNGVDMTSQKRFVEPCGYFTKMKSFDELMSAWDKVVRKLTRMSVIVENTIDLASEREVPDILCSTLVEDCIGRAKRSKKVELSMILSLAYKQELPIWQTAWQPSKTRI